MIQEYLKKGKEKEALFGKSLILQEGGELLPVSKEEDMFEHIDVRWKSPIKSKPCTFDIKGAKKNKRSDSDFSYKNTWLELQNVNGKPGSLYGNQDYIAFELQNEWAIVRRSELLDNLLTNIKDNTLYKTNPNENFKLYQREGRKDIIVRVPIDFIVKTARKYINK